MDTTMLELLRDERREIVSMKKNIESLESKNREKIKDCISSTYWDLNTKPSYLADYLELPNSVLRKFVHPREFHLYCSSCKHGFIYKAKSRTAIERKIKCTRCSKAITEAFIDHIISG